MVNGRVFREYVGGQIGVLAPQLDAIAQEERAERRAEVAAKAVRTVHPSRSELPADVRRRRLDRRGIDRPASPQGRSPLAARPRLVYVEFQNLFLTRNGPGFRRGLQFLYKTQVVTQDDHQVRSSIPTP